MKKLLGALAGVVLFPILLTGGLLIAVTGGMSGALAPASATDAAIEQIPPSLLDVYAAAADACPGLPWQVLAAIGSIEDPQLAAQIDPATGEIHPPFVGPDLDGQGGEPRIADPSQPSGWAHAEGPFQLLSTTWTRYGTIAPGDGHATPDPQNAWDSVFTLTHALCPSIQDSSGDLEATLSAYDPSPTWDQSVLQLALSYGMAGGDGPGSASEGSSQVPSVPPAGLTYAGQVGQVIAAAETQLGVPYVWGGERPGHGFDCSGLIQWAYGEAGISLPRTTYAQADLGVEVSAPWPTNVAPGDLLLMPGEDNGVTEPLGHIAMAIGDGLMIQAPYTGTVVQIDPIPWSDVELVRRVIT